MAADPNVVALSGDPLIAEALARFNRCAEWEAESRSRFIEDVKFANGDSDNGYQWPDAIRRHRDVDKRPCLTMNMIRQHNLQIKNEAKQNKSSIAVRAVGNGATKDAADVLSAVFRNIEYKSDAQDAYSRAAEFQVDGGIGWVRLVTMYEYNETFDQEIFIQQVNDPLSVYMDPDCQKKDCSDAKFAFIFVTMTRGEFLDFYPKFEDQAGLQPLGLASGDDDRVVEDHVRVCEYFRKTYERDVLVSFLDPNSGQRVNLLKSKMPENVYRDVAASSMSKTRAVWDEKIEWKLIAGEKVIDETAWPGKYIPLIRFIGEETVIEGILDRKGHTRAMKDAQRMYNYNASSQVEFVALQSKTPYIASAKAIEEYETMWNTANQINHSVLIYNSVDDNNPDTPLQPPKRQEPPNFSPGFEKGMDTSFNQMMMTSGQWQNQMGMQGNERTGAAISQRQAQSDKSVYHFQDNYGAALRYLAKQIIDLVPKIYDTRQVKLLQADDGTDLEIEIDPQAKQAYQQMQDQEGKVIRRVFNPQIGKYDVEADVGPSYGTRREETTAALTLILTQNPGLTGLIGDLLLSSMNFKEAQEAARRLKRMVPPQALGQGPSQHEQQLQQQVMTLQGLLAKALQAKGKDELLLKGKDEMRDIDAYDAETRRMAAMKNFTAAGAVDPEGQREIIEQLVQQSLKTSLSPIIQANTQDLQEPDGGGPLEAPPVPGARKADDGEWYLSDPTRRGRYLRIAPLAQQHNPATVRAM